MRLTAGQQVGPYLILAPLGRGGMAEVYRARDALGRVVALKILPAALSADAGRVRRLRAEASVLAELAHPNVVTLFDAGDVEGVAFVASELVEGETLRARLERGPLPVDTVYDYGRQLARGLAAAHDRGILHGDVTPSNVMLTADGVVKLLDFGLSRRTVVTPGETQTMDSAVDAAGTSGYMAPEQVRGEDVDVRTDVFALGILLHEMTSGRHPFAGATAADVQAAVLRDEPPVLTTAPLPMPSHRRPLPSQGPGGALRVGPRRRLAARRGRSLARCAAGRARAGTWDQTALAGRGRQPRGRWRPVRAGARARTDAQRRRLRPGTPDLPPRDGVRCALHPPARRRWDRLLGGMGRVGPGRVRSAGRPRGEVTWCARYGAARGGGHWRSGVGPRSAVPELRPGAGAARHRSARRQPPRRLAVERRRPTSRLAARRPSPSPGPIPRAGGNWSGHKARSSIAARGRSSACGWPTTAIWRGSRMARRAG